MDKITKLGVCVIIQNQNNDFLLHLRDNNTSRWPNNWCLIGGGIEDNESPKQAIIREVKEETGIKINKPVYIKTIKIDAEWDSIIFHVSIDTSNQKIVTYEGKKLKFFSKEQALSLINRLPYSNPFLEALKDYLIG